MVVVVVGRTSRNCTYALTHLRSKEASDDAWLRLNNYRDLGGSLSQPVGLSGAVRVWEVGRSWAIHITSKNCSRYSKAPLPRLWSAAIIRLSRPSLKEPKSQASSLLDIYTRTRNKSIIIQYDMLGCGCGAGSGLLPFLFVPAHNSMLSGGTRDSGDKDLSCLLELLRNEGS